MSCSPSCTESFKIDLTECPETIIVSAGLLPATDYAFLWTDKNGLEYYEYVLTDAAGAFVIDCSIFPDGMLNRHSGFHTLEVFQYFPYYYNNGLPADFDFCGDLYGSVTISFVSRTPQNVIQYIKCV